MYVTQCLNMQNTLYFSLHGVTEVPRKRDLYVYMFFYCLCASGTFKQ